MKKDLTYFLIKSFIATLATCFCYTCLKAEQNQCLLYSLDDSLDDLVSDSLQSAVSVGENKSVNIDEAVTQPANESDQFFYPNLFQSTTPQTENAAPAVAPNATPSPAVAPSAPVPQKSVPTQSMQQPSVSIPSNQIVPAQIPSTVEKPTVPVTPQPISTPTAVPVESPVVPVAVPPTAAPVAVPAPTVPPTTPGVAPIAPALTPAPAPQEQTPTPIFQPAAPHPTLNPAPAARPEATAANARPQPQQQSHLINFNNVAITEYIRFISRISNKNFVFDENDLQFTVTIVSEEPTTIDNIMTALLQELRIHGLELIEQDNTIIIHHNPKVTGISKVVAEDGSAQDAKNFDIVTRVFRLNTLEAERAAVILRPMISAQALIEVLKDTNHLIVTDLSTNIREVTSLIKSLDSPQSGLVIGQYVVRSQQMDALIAIAFRIVESIAQDQKINFIPHRAANSIFIVGSPYLVERTISILKYLDQTEASTQILNPKDLNFGTRQPNGHWELGPDGNWRFVPESAQKGSHPPVGNWRIDDQGNWYFEPGEPTGGAGPDGRWVRDKDGNWVFQLNAGKSISPQKVQRQERYSSELPIGHIERTQFSIYKLQYRKGEQIARALSRIAESLAVTGAGTNADLLAAINSVQWIESSNSLIFTGTTDAIDKMVELIQDIDVPLRQVLLEMLILETDIADSLNFSTNVASNFGGGNTSGSEGFFTPTINNGATNSLLPFGMATAGPGLIPNAAFATQPQTNTGFDLGIIGQTITHNGKLFATLGALVQALTQRTISKIVLNPKILTEDNSPAEVFVGQNTQYPTQSVANNFGTVVTQNFEYRDVGITLKVTPIIGNNDVITLEIQQEFSSIISGGGSSQTTSGQLIGPTTKVNRTTTKVHVPNKFFLIISGALSDNEERTRTQTPCLGSIPIVGAAFSAKTVTDTKQNVMIFIHPVIIDTEEEIDNITRHEQNLFRVKNRRPKEWVMETTEAMDYFNIIDTENSDGTEDCY